MQTTATTDYKALYEQSMLEVLYLKQQLVQLQKMIFGSKQERFIPAEINPAQLSLAIQAETIAACSVTEAKKISYTRTDATVEQKPLQHPGRMKLRRACAGSSLSLSLRQILPVVKRWAKK